MRFLIISGTLQDSSFKVFQFRVLRILNGYVIAWAFCLSSLISLCSVAYLERLRDRLSLFCLNSLISLCSVVS